MISDRGIRYQWNPRTAYIHKGDSVRFEWISPPGTSGSYSVHQTMTDVSTTSLEDGFNSGEDSSAAGMLMRKWNKFSVSQS